MIKIDYEKYNGIRDSMIDITQPMFCSKKKRKRKKRFICMSPFIILEYAKLQSFLCQLVKWHFYKRI